LQLDNIEALINSDIRLRESDHTYILDGEPKIGFYNVTNLVEGQFPPFEREKIARWLVNTSYKYMDYTVEELLLEWEDIKDEGSAVHKELENYILTGKIPALPKAISGMNWYDQEIKFYGDKVFPEVIVFSEELEVAGTLDLLVYNSNNGECNIFDWKTSKKIDHDGRKQAITRAGAGLTDCRFDQYSLQLSMYSHLLENYHDIKVTNQYLVQLTETDAKCIESKNLDHNVRLIFENL
jgi:ATP-dependent exoDNAse (exonuclease V) beta subunit